VLLLITLRLRVTLRLEFSIDDLFALADFWQRGRHPPELPNALR